MSACVALEWALNLHTNVIRLLRGCGRQRCRLGWLRSAKILTHWLGAAEVDARGVVGAEVCALGCAGAEVPRVGEDEGSDSLELVGKDVNLP